MYIMFLPTDFGLKVAEKTPFSYSVVSDLTSSLGEQYSINTSLLSDSDKTYSQT